MSYLKAIAVGLGCSAVITGVYLWQREPAATAAPAARATARATAAPLASPLTVAPAARAAGPTPLRAAITHAFGSPPLSRALLDRVAAGDVAAVARELAATDDAAAAVHHADLAALCAAEGHAPPEGGTADERVALDASAGAAEAHALIAAQIDARHAWQSRFAAGCAGAPALDAATVHRHLAAFASRGDATSLERLSREDGAPPARLQSAALLGNARAQFRIALGTPAAQPGAARSWLEAAAKTDAEADAYYALCLLGGCAGPPDPGLARTELESAARGGSLYALGLLASALVPDGPRRWTRSDSVVTPIVTRDLDGLALDPAQEYAWASLAAALATTGCFGFEFGVAGDALELRTRLGRALLPVELDTAQSTVRELEESSGGALRHSLGCD